MVVVLLHRLTSPAAQPRAALNEAQPRRERPLREQIERTFSRWTIIDEEAFDVTRRRR
jgi:hypothetical protein